MLASKKSYHFAHSQPNSLYFPGQVPALGGGVELCFWKLLLLRSRELFSDSESEVVQSLSEFRVFAADKCKEQKKTEHKQLYRFLPQTGSSPVLLALPMRVLLKCNLKFQVAQSHKKETYLCSRTPPRDFYAQSHLKETSMLKDTSKRLLCSITPERDLT